MSGNTRSFMNCFVAILLVLYGAEGATNGTEVNEARGPYKYALLTHLAFLLAAKAGLYKIALAIVLVVASMKAMVVMAWALAIFKYAPDVWPTYKHADITYHGYDKYHDSIHERPSNFLDYVLGHFVYGVVAKLVILKIVYGFILFALLYKAWHFVLWFIHYLKEKKKEEHIEIEHDFGHDYGHDFGHHGFGHHGYGHHDFKHHNFGHDPYQGYISSSYSKDEYYPQKKKGMYDADGSYSVKGAR